MRPDLAPAVPEFVKLVKGELEEEYWKPQSLSEWTEIQKVTISLSEWSQQQKQERGLRKLFGIWIFFLITLQVFGVFGIIMVDAFSSKKIDSELLKILIPSVFGEIFGMGFLILKYLFRSTGEKELKVSKNIDLRI